MVSFYADGIIIPNGRACNRQTEIFPVRGSGNAARNRPTRRDAPPSPYTGRASRDCRQGQHDDFTENVEAFRRPRTAGEVSRSDGGGKTIPRRTLFAGNLNFLLTHFVEVWYTAILPRKRGCQHGNEAYLSAEEVTRAENPRLPETDVHGERAESPVPPPRKRPRPPLLLIRVGHIAIRLRGGGNLPPSLCC